jgi:8-oxo-dGTP diphosphatase
VTAPSTPIVVAAAVVERGGRFLLTRRLAGTHLAGAWEFPGGKCVPGEERTDCLVRELREELGVGASVGPLVLETVHHYPERSVALFFYRCELDGEPLPLLGQEMRWVPREDLRTLEFPEADAALIALLCG